MNFRELLNHPNTDIRRGAKGWIKAKCLDTKCNTITVWNSKATGVKCEEGSCAKCGGKVKRTTWSGECDYIIKGEV
jgi:hypothetical protein